MIRDAYDHPTWLAVALVGSLVVIVALIAAQNRRYLSRTDRKQCRHCDGIWPANARFCGRCGKSF